MKEILEGLQILSKYFPDGDFHGEHDQIWAGGEIKEGTILDEDMKRLEELRWFIDEESYSHFC